MKGFYSNQPLEAEAASEGHHVMVLHQILDRSPSESGGLSRNS